MNSIRFCAFLVLSTLLSSSLHAQGYAWQRSFDRGKIELHAGDFLQAISYFKSVLQNQPKHTEAQFLMAKSHFLLRQWQVARQGLNRVHELDSNFAEAYLYQGFLDYSQNAYEEAIRFFDRYLLLNSHDPLAYNYRGECYRELGLLQAAIHDYSEAIRIASPNPILHFGRAKCHMYREAYSEALADMQSALHLDPKNPEFLAYRADLHYLMENYQAASQDIDDLYSLNAEAMGLHYHYLNAYCKSKLADYQGAISAMDEVIRNEAVNPAHYAERALYYAQIEEWDQAIQDYQQAIYLDEEQDTYHAAIARILQDTQRYTEAKDAWGKAIQIDKKRSNYWYERAECYLRLGNKTAAKFNYREAARLGYPAVHMSKTGFKYAKKIYKRRRVKK